MPLCLGYLYLISIAEIIARELADVEKDKEKLTHRPLLTRHAALPAASILSSTKLEDCYIKELCGDKLALLPPNRKFQSFGDRVIC